jgi:hypothetical protein
MDSSEAEGEGRSSRWNVMAQKKERRSQGSDTNDTKMETIRETVETVA